MQVGSERCLRRRTLLGMYKRWSNDLERFADAYSDLNWDHDHPEVEVQRNLATAIAQIEFMLARTPKDPHPCK